MQLPGTGRGSRKPGVTLDHHGGAACLSPLIFPVLIYNQLLFILLSPFLHSIGVLPEMEVMLEDMGYGP